MDHREVRAGGMARNARDAVARTGRDGASLLQIEVRCMRDESNGRQRGEELEREAQCGDSFAELRAIGPIPGDDGVEPAQSFEQTLAWTGQLERSEERRVGKECR